MRIFLITTAASEDNGVPQLFIAKDMLPNYSKLEAIITGIPARAGGAEGGE
jgi:hypothetical protein